MLASLRFFSWVKSLKRQRRNRKACQHHNECDCQLGYASSENKHFRNRSKPVSSPDYGGKHRLQTTDQKESWRQAPSLTNWLPTLWVAELVSSFFVQGESDTFRVRRTAKLQKSQHNSTVAKLSRRLSTSAAATIPNQWCIRVVLRLWQRGQSTRHYLCTSYASRIQPPQ